MYTDSQRDRSPKVTTMQAYAEVWSLVEGAQDRDYTVPIADAAMTDLVDES